ncbi:hypothetical protein ACJX0J_032234, partial [Zea mays]
MERILYRNAKRIDAHLAGEESLHFYVILSILKESETCFVAYSRDHHELMHFPRKYRMILISNVSIPFILVVNVFPCAYFLWIVMTIFYYLLVGHL